MEAKTKSGSFLTKSCGPALEPPTHMLLCAPPRTTTIFFAPLLGALAYLAYAGRQ